MKVYNIGYEKLMKELDVKKLIKTIINLRTIVKKKFNNDPYLLTI
jgi:hypothetical protein